MSLYFALPFFNLEPTRLQPCMSPHPSGWTCAPGCLGCSSMSALTPLPTDDHNSDLDLTADCGADRTETLGPGWDGNGDDFGPGESVDLVRYDTEFTDERGQPVIVWGVHSEIAEWRHAAIFATLEEATVEYDSQVRWMLGDS